MPLYCNTDQQIACHSSVQYPPASVPVCYHSHGVSLTGTVTKFCALCRCEIINHLFLVMFQIGLEASGLFNYKVKLQREAQLSKNSLRCDTVLWSVVHLSIWLGLRI